MYKKNYKSTYNSKIEMKINSIRNNHSKWTLSRYKLKSKHKQSRHVMSRWTIERDWYQINAKCDGRTALKCEHVFVHESVASTLCSSDKILGIPGSLNGARQTGVGLGQSNAHRHAACQTCTTVWRSQTYDWNINTIVAGFVPPFESFWRLVEF